LEANAVGKPVIGGRTGGTPEAIADGSTGFLVNPDDPDEIAGRLRQLLLDPGLRERLGAAGVRRVRSDFSWETRARILRGVNLDILKRDGRKLEFKARVSNIGENPTGSEILQRRTEDGSAKKINDKEGDLVSLERDGEHRLVPIERRI